MAEEATAPIPSSSDKVEETSEAVGSNDVPTTSEVAAAPSGDEPTNGAMGVDKAADPSDENALAEDATNAPDATAAAANGATDSAKKNSKRKSTGGTVPEHKNKKLNRKKSMPNLNLDAKAGEYWFIHMKGYPPWPGIICDEEMLPESLLKTRPVSAMRTDGTYREDFMPGGKNARDRRYPVMFLGTNEFGWHVNTDIAPLDMDDVKAVVEKDEQGKRSKALWEAYKIAAEGHDLKHFKEVLAEHEQYAREIAEEKAAKDAEKAEKAAKKAERAEKAATKGEKAAKRKSKGAADEEEEEDVEMEDAEGDEAPKKAKSSKKRKKDADSDGETAKPAKTPKIKVNGPKTPAADSAKPKKTKSAKRAKEEVAEAEPEKEEEPELSPEEKLAKREKGVLYLRHKLQKGLVTREEPPKEDEMPAMAEHFKTLEQYTNLEATIIKNTKIHKVLKAIIKVNSIPRDDEFKFKERSHKLLEEWTATLQAEADSGAVAEGPPAVTTNGVNHEEAMEDAKAAEAGDFKSAPAQEAKAAEEVVQETEKKESEPKIEKELEADKTTEPADTTMEDAKEAAAEVTKEEATTES